MVFAYSRHRGDGGDVRVHLGRADGARAVLAVDGDGAVCAVVQDDVDGMSQPRDCLGVCDVYPTRERRIGHEAIHSARIEVGDFHVRRVSGDGRLADPAGSVDGK